MFFKVSALKIFAIFACKPLCLSLFIIVAGPKAYSFIEKRFQDRCFPVSIVELLRTAFYIEHLWWLLLQVTVQNSKRVPGQSLF